VEETARAIVLENCGGVPHAVVDLALLDFSSSLSELNL